MHETSTLPEDVALDEPTDAKTIHELDTLAMPVSDGPPSDVMEIVASLDADIVQMALSSEETSSEESAPAAATQSASHAEAEPIAQGALTGEVATAIEPEKTTPDTAPRLTARADPELPESIEGAGSDGVRIPIWPFLAYVAVWVAGAGGAGWLLCQTASGIPIFSTRTYEMTVIAGLGLTVMGPLLALVVWVALALRTRGTSRAGLFTRTLLRGAVATLCGVALWWTMLLIVDTLRLGGPL